MVVLRGGAVFNERGTPVPLSRDLGGGEGRQLAEAFGPGCREIRSRGTSIIRNSPPP